jgi:DNA-3-methyladenine glycosylase I
MYPGAGRRRGPGCPDAMRRLAAQGRPPPTQGTDRWTGFLSVPSRRFVGVTDLVIGVDGLARCAWGGGNAEYLAYHDDEWGRPVRGDDALYERLTLEAFQSGLSWLTILRKRAAFRRAFDDFAIDKVAGFTDADVTRLLGDVGIVRNRLKVEAALTNARAAAGLPGGLAALLWSHAPASRPRRPASAAEVPPLTPGSTAMAKDLKKRGFKFVGPTTAYALMQATGMVDDHLAGCHVQIAAPAGP